MKSKKKQLYCSKEEKSFLASNKIIVLISIKNNGTVKFGPYNTENGQMKKTFPKGKNITLEATAEKNYIFDYWQQKVTKEGGFSFLSSKSKIVLKAPDKSREIKAFFAQSEGK